MRTDASHFFSWNLPPWILSPRPITVRWKPRGQDDLRGCPHSPVARQQGIDEPENIICYLLSQLSNYLYIFELNYIFFKRTASEEFKTGNVAIRGQLNSYYSDP